MASFINLTPHALNLHNESGDGLRLEPSGQIARVTSEQTTVRKDGGIPIYRVEFGAVDGLPEPANGVLYIVSALVRTAVPERADVASPGSLIRDEQGQPVGCLGLVVN